VIAPARARHSSNMRLTFNATDARKRGTRANATHAFPSHR
jgi:hypothetical protein